MFTISQLKINDVLNSTESRQGLNVGRTYLSCLYRPSRDEIYITQSISSTNILWLPAHRFLFLELYFVRSIIYDTYVYSSLNENMFFSIKSNIVTF